MSDKEFDLNTHTARLLLDEPFFAAISRRIDKRASNAIPTAGVMVNPDTAQFEMLYNPKFFEDLTDLNRTDILKHEFYHILFEHVTGRMPENVNVETAEGRRNLADRVAVYLLHGRLGRVHDRQTHAAPIRLHVLSLIHI